MPSADGESDQAVGELRPLLSVRGRGDVGQEPDRGEVAVLGGLMQRRQTVLGREAGRG